MFIFIFSKSFRSSKNKRKHERKLYSLKEGNKYEDLALIRSLHQLITKTYLLINNNNNINKLLLILMELNEEHKAKQLQQIFKQLLNQINEYQNIIWMISIDGSESESRSDNDTTQQYGPNMTTNSIINATKQQQQNNTIITTTMNLLGN